MTTVTTSGTPITDPLVAYCGNDLFDISLALFFNSGGANYLSDSGNITEMKVQYTYRVEKTPTAMLGPSSGGSTPYDIALHFSSVLMQVYQLNDDSSRGNKLFDVSRAATAYATLGMADGKLSFTSLEVDIEGSSLGDKVLQRVITCHIIPSLQSRLIGFVLPQVQNVFDTGIGVSLSGAVIIPADGSNYALMVGAAISGANVSSADQASPDDLASLNSANPDGWSAMLLGIVSGGAVNYLIGTLIGPIQQPFKQKKSKHTVGGGVRGTFHLSTPHISFSSGQATASATLSTSLELGVGAFVGVKHLEHWTWERIPVPDASATVTFALETHDGKKCVLHLTGVESIDIDLGNWPKIFHPVKSMIEGLIQDVIGEFHDKINSAVKTVKAPLFSLPDTIPGTNIPATLNFASNGLGFFASSVTALISATSN